MRTALDAIGVVVMIGAVVAIVVNALGGMIERYGCGKNTGTEL